MNSAFDETNSRQRITFCLGFLRLLAGLALVGLGLFSGCSGGSLARNADGARAKEGGRLADAGTPTEGALPRREVGAAEGALPRDGAAPARDGAAPARDGAAPARDGTPLARDSGAPARDSGAPARDRGGPAADKGARDQRVPPPAVCESNGGGAAVAKPVLFRHYFDRWHEGWLASVAVADLDGDGTKELIAARDELLIVWNLDGGVKFKRDVVGRIWSSPVVVDLLPGRKGLEIAVAARGRIYAWDATGAALPGFPVTFRDELRSLAAGDIDGDGALELVAVTNNPLDGNGTRDIVIALKANGATVKGFPPNTTGTSGCDQGCTITGGYDQNLALGDITGDGKLEIFATQDNAYLSLHRGDGRVFDASPIFRGKSKWPGIRFMIDYQLAQQGYADDEQRDNQAHFTNSAPAIADLDGDGKRELIVLGSVQNAAQSDRERGVVLFALNSDGTRPKAWEQPRVISAFLSGLWDFDGTNVVAATNQVSVADIDGSSAGPELVFAGFDGQIHSVSADNRLLWSRRYTSDPRVLTAGIALADLSGDGVPELIFASYSPDANKSQLFIWSAAGNELQRVALPGRGSMAVPTIADLDGDGALEIALPLKDAVDKAQMVIVYRVPGSSTRCLPWPTGRANLARNAFVR